MRKLPAFLATLLLLVTAPLAAQEPVVTPEAPDPEPREAADPVPSEPAEVQPTHDWEFALTATGRVPDVSGAVQVTEGEADNAFVIAISGLPDVDSLDEEGRDLEQYTVWIVPSKERVRESTLAGTLTVSDQGTSRFEGQTDLETFGIIVMASAADATELSGVPILTGIPVAEEAVPTAPAAAEGDAVPMPVTPEPAPENPEPAPENPETEEPAPSPTPEVPQR